MLAKPTSWVSGGEKRTWGLGSGRSVTKGFHLGQDKMGGLVSEPIGQTTTTSLIRLVLAACPGMEWDGIEKTGSAIGSVFLGGRSL